MFDNHKLIKLKSLFFCCTLIYQTYSRSSEIIFFENNSPAPGYAQNVQSAKPGDHLRFSFWKTFTVKEVLGKNHTFEDMGAMSAVFRVSETNAIKVPLSGESAGQLENDDPCGAAPRPGRLSSKCLLSNVHMSNKFFDPRRILSPHRRELQSFYLSMKELNKSDLQSVKVLSDESSSMEFVEVEYLNIQFLASEYFSNNYLLENPISKKDQEFIDQMLIEFFKSSWQWQKIGDFKLQQFGWDGVRWVLFDSSLGNIPWDGKSHQTVADSLSELPQHVLKKSRHEILKLREENRCSFLLSQSNIMSKFRGQK